MILENVSNILSKDMAGIMKFLIEVPCWPCWFPLCAQSVFVASSCNDFLTESTPCSTTCYRPQNCKKRKLTLKWITCTGHMVGAPVGGQG